MGCLEQQGEKQLPWPSMRVLCKKEKLEKGKKRPAKASKSDKNLNVVAEH